MQTSRKKNQNTGKRNSKKTPALKSVGRSPRKPRSGKYDKILHVLEQQRKALLDEAASVLTNRSTLPTFPDMGDQASAEVDQGFTLRLREREQKLLKKIDEALGRMTNNTYGICEGCGEEIPYQRLKARPVTTFCIQCKTLQEEEERVRG